MFRLIIVEDEPPILRNIRERIKAVDLDFKIVGEYSNGEDALLEIEILKPHVVLSDIRMPVMDGIAFIEKLKLNHPEIQCAFLSGYQDFEYARQAMMLGVQDYLLKPATTDTIRVFLQKMKKNLTENQRFVEAELLRAWASSQSSMIVEHTSMEQEYFYHPVYITCYVWNKHPFSSQEQAEFSTLFQNLLSDGEKYYSFSNILGNEWICVLGVYQLSAQRIQQWQEKLENAFTMQVSSVLLPTMKLKHQLKELLEKARTSAKLINRIGLSTVRFVNETEGQPVELPPVMPEEDHRYLISFFENKRKQEFLSELTNYIRQINLSSITRGQWVQSLRLLLNTLWLKASMAKEQLLVMQGDIENVIWQADSITDLETNLNQLFASLFQDALPEPEASWVEDMEQYLHLHYAENITLHSLSERYHLNALYLSRVFTRKRNLSPTDYLIQLRMLEAQRLIREYPRLLFKEIAVQVGYTDPYYFSKLFKQYFGVTLTEYKNSLS